LAKESTRNINYCSEVGVAITFGKEIIRTQGGCIHATLLWSPMLSPIMLKCTKNGNEKCTTRSLS